MKHVNFLPIFLVAVGVLLIPATVRSGCPSNVTIVSGTPAPESTQTNIRLDSEVVIVQPKERGYIIQAVYRFFNTGKQVTEKVGFPKHPKWQRWTLRTCPDPRHIVADLSGFEARVDSVKLVCAEEAGFRGESRGKWLVCLVAFPGYSSTTMTVRYLARYGAYSTAGYVYGTGAYWKGKIGKTVFVIDSSEVGGAEKTRVRFPRFSVILMSQSMRLMERRHFEPSPEDSVSLMLLGPPS